MPLVFNKGQTIKSVWIVLEEFKQYLKACVYVFSIKPGLGAFKPP